MKQFQLSRQPRGQTTTRFHVIASDNSVCGIITVPNEEVDDLERHWVASSPAPAARTAAGKQNLMVKAMTEAARRHPLNQQAILRG